MLFTRLIRPSEKTFFLLGARGTGKSTWIRQAFPDGHVIDLLDERVYHGYLVNPGLFSDEVRALPQKKWIILDEVQRLPTLLNEVHRWIEKDRRKFVLCGSSSRKLKRAGVNLLGGRAARKTMHPLLPFELGKKFDIRECLSYGSIPLILAGSNRSEALQDYVRMYLKEEIQAEAVVRNLPSFARFLPVASLFHGQVLNISSLGRDAGVQRNTVAGYLEILEDTLLAFRLPAFEGKLRVREKSHPKFYFIDPGLVRSLKGNRGALAQEERGTLFEGWVIGMIRALNDYRPFFDEMYYWAPIGSKVEVDLLLTSSKQTIAIEVKSGTSIRPEDLRGLRAIGEQKRVKKRVVVYTGETKLNTEDGIEILPLSDFLSWLLKECGIRS